MGILVFVSINNFGFSIVAFKITSNKNNTNTGAINKSARDLLSPIICLIILFDIVKVLIYYSPSSVL
ncbi:hypothetical protein SDC9_206777 [bioreactor metagenome]|uniref:Uncharacterized protein n=1 Tax=bioreactor metagenome TaxID=1076179 RepID=A0A645J8M4_9ZZZZ